MYDVVTESGICFCLQDEGDRKVRLSGYGVELAIKSTEYKAQDDSKQV